MVSPTDVSTHDTDAHGRPFIDVFINLYQRAPLIRLLVTRDLTVRYKRSVLGVWWTLLNPLLTTLVMWIVFSQIFNRESGDDVPFVVYLLSGVLFISTYFAQGVMASGASLVNSRGILSKIAVPGEIFAFTAAIAAMVNFLIGLVPLLIVQLITGVGIPWTIVLVPIPMIAMLLFVTGIGMVVAAAAVHFYDVLDFVRVIIQLSIWLVPTFYPIEIIGEPFQTMIKINPLYSYLVVFRGFVYGGTFAPAWNFAVMGISAVVFLGIGVWVFARSWRNLVAYL